MYKRMDKIVLCLIVLNTVEQLRMMSTDNRLADLTAWSFSVMFAIADFVECAVLKTDWLGSWMILGIVLGEIERH